MSDAVAAPVPVRIPVRGGGMFPVRRVYCVGRNFADHAREMGASVPGGYGTTPSTTTASAGLVKKNGSGLSPAAPISRAWAA